jgi:hypothetical protein
MADTSIRIEIKAVDKASAALAKIEKQLSPMKKKVGNIDKEFDKVDKSIQRTSSSFGKFKGLLAGAITVGGIGAFGKSVLEASGNAEDLKVALETVTGSASAADQAFANIREFTESTPFKVDNVAESFIKLQNAGLEPMELLGTLGDAAAVSSDKVGALAAVTDLYSRTVAGGLGLEDLDRLQDRGIPVYDILMEKLGKTRNEMSEFGKTAAGAAQARDALTEGFQERFGGGMDRASETLNGRLSTLGDTIQGLLIKVGEGGLTDAINNVTVKFTNFIKENEDLAFALGDKLGQAVEMAFDGFVGLMGILEEAQPIFDLIGKVLKEIIGPALRVMFDFLVKVAEALGPLIDASLPLAKSLFEGIGNIIEENVIPAFNAIVDTVTTVIDSITLMIDKIGAGLAKVKEFGSGVKNTVTSGMSKAGESISNFGSGAKQSFWDLYDYVVGNSVIPDMVEGVKGWLGNKLHSVLGSVKDFVGGAKGYFWDLYDKVVGNSIIPDMVKEVGVTMDKLPTKMVNPIEKGVAESRKAFDPLQSGFGSATANSNVNFNISGVSAGGGSGQFEQSQMEGYIKGVATQVAYQVLRQNTGFGGLVR